MTKKDAAVGAVDDASRHDAALNWLNAAAAWAFALALLAAIEAHLEAEQHRAWQPNVAQEPWAEVKGDEVTLHNVRNCDYRTEANYTSRWETARCGSRSSRGSTSRSIIGARRG